MSYVRIIMPTVNNVPVYENLRSEYIVKYVNSYEESLCTPRFWRELVSEIELGRVEKLYLTKSGRIKTKGINKRYYPTRME